jgi:DNA invertase Pin-like site-specific DNA recombinase
MQSAGKFVAYFRVSTARQGRSGLGIEAQREAVKAYLNGGDWQIVAEFTEVESGKRADRPELDKALDAARLHRACLVVSKVDRLTRSVAFLSCLLEAGVDVRFADLPAIEGATGRFMLQQMVAVAELEAGMISARTKGRARSGKAARQGARRQSRLSSQRQDAQGLYGGLGEAHSREGRSSRPNHCRAPGGRRDEPEGHRGQAQRAQDPDSARRWLMDCDTGHARPRSHLILFCLSATLPRRPLADCAKHAFPCA